MSINNNRAKYILIKRQADYYGRDQSLQDGMQCCFQLHLEVLCPESLNEKSRHKFRRPHCERTFLVLWTFFLQDTYKQWEVINVGRKCEGPGCTFVSNTAPHLYIRRCSGFSKVQSFSRLRALVSSSRRMRQACLAAASSAEAERALKRSSPGTK